MKAAVSSSCSSLLSAKVCVLGCCRSGPLDPALEVSKKGTLKLDLQALTVGVAVLSMHHWLVQLRPQLASEPAAGPEASRKLAVVNGMGENNRTQVRHPGPPGLHCHWCLCAEPGVAGSVLEDSCWCLLPLNDLRLPCELSCSAAKLALMPLPCLVPDPGLPMLPAGELVSSQGGCRGVLDRLQGAVPPGVGPQSLRAPGGVHAVPQEMAFLPRL